MTVLISDEFRFGEAVLFWNLRANHVIVTWASFEQLRKEQNTVSEWLDSDYGGTFYAFGGDIAFAASVQNESKLNDLFADLTDERGQRYPRWKKLSYEQLHSYDRERPALNVSYLAVNRGPDRASFLPSYPADVFGRLGLTIEWPPVKLPQNQRVANLLSPEELRTWVGFGALLDEKFDFLTASRFRITNTRDIRLSISDDSPVSFVVPQVFDVFRTLFAAASFVKISDGSCSQYQKSFIRRPGDLNRASQLLRDETYRDLFMKLANFSQNSSLPGWVLKEPKRRALRQLELFNAFAGPFISRFPQ